MRSCVALCACICLCCSSVLAQDSLGATDLDSTAFTPKSSESDVNRLELAGSDSFEYDIANKIRKAKSSVQIGIGMNFTQNATTKALQVNVSGALGYSYFFTKNIGLRAQGIVDNTQTSFFGGIGVDVLWDFIQTEPFGIGVFIGSSMGYQELYSTNQQGGFLGQFHSGIGLIFDGGRSRLEGMVRLPYNTISSTQQIRSNITYILMYSYTF